MYPNLKAEMARRGVTSTMLAEVLGITLGTFSLKFNGKSEWTFSEVAKIKKFLDVDIPIETLFSTDEVC